MCRSIKTLRDANQPATDEDIEAAALQFVRKISGFRKPSKANEQAFQQAIDDVTDAAERLLDLLVTNAPARNREVEAAKARERVAKRFGQT